MKADRGHSDFNNVGSQPSGPKQMDLSLIPQPSVSAVLLLRVAQKHLLVHAGRCSACKEITLHLEMETV